MELVDVYKYCPRCQTEFSKNSNRLLICPNCKFKQYLNPVPCNGVIIVNEKNQIMLVKRKSEPKKGYWDLPGGFIEPGESFEESVKREIKEELGIEIEMTKLVGIYNDYYLYEGVNIPTFGVVVEAKIKSGELSINDDITDYQFFNKAEVLQQELAFDSLRKGLEDYLK